MMFLHWQELRPSKTGGRSIEGIRSSYFLQDVNFRSLNNGGAQDKANGAPFTPASLFSIFGQVSYAWDDRILASATVRRDGSSRFGPNFRYGTFPAFSLGWRISRESFMRDIKWITDMKIRGGWGQMGNQKGVFAANSYNAFVGNPGSSNYDINGTSNSNVAGFQQSFVGNPDGKWETIETSNIGVDATLFNGHTEVIIDWYTRKSKDLLYRLPAVATAGAGAATNPAFSNVSSIKNSGLDLMITQRGMLGGKNGVKLDGTLTFTTYSNEIQSLAPGIDFYDTRGSRIGNWVRNAAGHPVSSFFGYQVAGLFQSDTDVNEFSCPGWRRRRSFQICRP